MWKKQNLRVLGAGLLLFGGLVALNLLVDPFQMNPGWSLSLNQKQTAYKKDYRLWTALAIRNQPPQVLILGDSRAANLGAPSQPVQGKTVVNAAYGGGSLQEAVLTFWHAAEGQSLEKVYWALNFDTFSENSTRDNLTQAQKIAKNEFTYYSNIYVSRISLLTLRNHLQGKATDEAPDMNREAFWKAQLDSALGNALDSWVKPQRMRAELEKIAGHCRRENIELVFFVPPVHRDLRQRLQEGALAAEYEAFIEDIRRLGPVIDFDFDNAVTNDREQFGDPFHIRGEMVGTYRNLLLGAAPPDPELMRSYSALEE